MTEPRTPSKLIYRLTLAPILIAVIVGVLLLDHHYRQVMALRVVVAIVSVLCLYEFAAMCRMKGITPAWISGSLFLLFSPFLWHGIELPRAVMLLLLYSPTTYVVYAVLKFIGRPKSFSRHSAGLSLVGYIYVGLLALIIVTPTAVGGRFLWYYLFIFFCAKGSDMAAFSVGKAIGKHKMAPRISPNKTWEGGIAGGIVGTAAGLGFLLWSPLKQGYEGVPWPALLFFALFVTIASQAGDLIESAIKRWAGAKDSGRLLPSFGGMLDMADSFLVAVPVAYLLSELLSLSFGG